MDASYVSALQATTEQLAAQNRRLRRALAGCVTPAAMGTGSLCAAARELASESPTVTRSAVALALAEVEAMAFDYFEKGFDARDVAAEINRRIKNLQATVAPAVAVSRQALLLALAGAAVEGRPVFVDEAAGWVQLDSGQVWDPLHNDSDSFRLLARMLQAFPAFMEVVKHYVPSRTLNCPPPALRRAVVLAAAELMAADEHDVRHQFHPR